MKQINALLGLSFVLVSIGVTYGLVSADTSKTHKTHKTISRNTEEKPQPIRFGSGGYFITNPQTQGQRAYNDLVKSLYENKYIPESNLYDLLDPTKKAILLGDEVFYSYCRQVRDGLRLLQSR